MRVSQNYCARQYGVKKLLNMLIYSSKLRYLADFFLVLSSLATFCGTLLCRGYQVKGVCMAITDWPVNERPREKLLMQGAASLSDAELLAIFLRTGVHGCSAVELARNLLQSFGGLRQLLEANQSSFCSAKGLGPAKFTQLQAVLEMNRRHLAQELEQGSVMDNPGSVSEYLISQLRHLKREVFACLLLDNKHCVLGFEILFQGSISSAQVHPREVVKTALSYNAAAIILAHNHPSGIAEPSMADRQITERLTNALALIEVNVIDHIIIGSSAPVSFAERGLL